MEPVVDPRLLHSRGLTYTAIIYENLQARPAQLVDWIMLAIVDLTEALNIFERDFKSRYNELLMHVIISIKNTKCDLQTKLFELDNKIYAPLISEETRPMLNSFKKDLKFLEEDYNEYPTYNHTEVDVEYCEAIIAQMKGDISEAKRKIKHAKNRFDNIEHSIVLSDYEYLQDTGKKVSDLYDLLNNSKSTE